jgi:hypothetical protein
LVGRVDVVGGGVAVFGFLGRLVVFFDGFK